MKDPEVPQEDGSDILTWAIVILLGVIILLSSCEPISRLSVWDDVDNGGHDEEQKILG